MIRIKRKDLLKVLPGLLRLARLETRPAQSVPGLRVFGIEFNGSLELQNGFSRFSALPELPAFLCKLASVERCELTLSPVPLADLRVGRPIWRDRR